MSALTLNISKKASNSHEEFLNAKSILKIEMKLGEKMSPIMEMISTAFRKYDSKSSPIEEGITLLQITSSRHSKNLTTIGFRKGELNPFLFTDKLIEISQRNYFL